MFFNFDSKIYKHTDGVAMGSLLGSTLANAFLCFHEQTWLDDYPEDFKPVYYSLNSKHKRIKFSHEKKSNNSLLFLDILISR